MLFALYMSTQLRLKQANKIIFFYFSRSHIIIMHFVECIYIYTLSLDNLNKYHTMQTLRSSMSCAIQIMVYKWMACKRTIKSIQVAERDQSTCLRILTKGFLKNLAPTRPEVSIKRIAPTDQTA